MATITDFNQLKNKNVLVIFPHPDDETVMAGGFIIAAIKAGAKVKIICLTAGDQGKIHVHGRGRSLGQIRREEFFRAMQRLGVSNFEIFNFLDGKLRNTPVWRPVVADFVGNADLVVSYDLSGVTGHPDHIALGRQLHCQIRKLGPTLWHVAPTGILRRFLAAKKVVQYLSTAKIELSLSFGERLRKWWAFNAYQSQYRSSTRLLGLIISLLPQSEGFALFRPKQKYRFKYIHFEF